MIATDIGGTIVTVVEAPEPNAPEANIVTTGLFVGTLDAAVYVAVCPLAVWVGETEPQAAVEVEVAAAQFTDQVTPEFVGSLATTAVIGAVAFGSIVLGGT